MRILTTLAVLLFLGHLRAQPVFLNQYNASMGGLNPSFIVGPDRSQFSLAARSQWRQHRMNGILGTFSLNLLSKRINHGIGIFAEHNEQSGALFNTSAGLRWGYRVIFLSKFYLCVGATVRYSDISQGYLYPTFSAAPEFAPWPDPLYRKLITADAGISLYSSNGRYAGLSVRDIHLPILEGDTIDALTPGKTISIQGLHHLTISRESQLLMFFSFDRGFARNRANEAFSFWQTQLNYYLHKKIIAGIGYKRVGPFYGHMTTRFGVFPGERWFVGYSYDMKPYIWDNKIHWNPSHELMIKIRLQQNTEQ